MFTHSAALYDAIYGSKDYAREAERVHALIQEHRRSDGNALLDVACGTGRHIAELRAHYQVEGLDLDEGLLGVAREHNPGVPFHQGDMLDFELGRRFDAVTCLFSAVAYARTVGGLQRAIQCMGRHLRPGGVLLVEPFFSPEDYHAGTVHATFVDQPELKIARMTLSRVEDGLAVNDFDYLVATPQGVEHFTERHAVGLFTHVDYLSAFEAAELEVTYDREGLIGRGLYIATRPLTQ
jgi:SAM-dependent methyltransferase